MDNISQSSVKLNKTKTLQDKSYGGYGGSDGGVILHPNYFIMGTLQFFPCTFSAKDKFNVISSISHTIYDSMQFYLTGF